MEMITRYFLYNILKVGKECSDFTYQDVFHALFQEIVIRNLDYIFTVSSHAMASAAPDILANLENLLDQRSSETWSYRRLPTPTATFPAIVYSEEDDSENEVQRTRDNHTKISTSRNELNQRLDSFLQPTDDPNRGICRQVRALRKKLQQIDMLEVKQSKGHLLDDQQIAKLQTRSALESSLAELGDSVETSQVKVSPSVWPDGKGNKKAEQSRKQKKKSKHRAAQMGIASGICGNELETDPAKELLDAEISQVSKNKVKFSFLYWLCHSSIKKKAYDFYTTK